MGERQATEADLATACHWPGDPRPVPWERVLVVLSGVRMILEITKPEGPEVTLTALAHLVASLAAQSGVSQERLQAYIAHLYQQPMIHGAYGPNEHH